MFIQNKAVKELKRFLVFAGQLHPRGGWGDFRGSFDTLEEANERVNKLTTECWSEIVDTHYEESED